MIRALIKLILILIVLVGAGAFLLQWWGSGRLTPAGEAPASAPSTGRAREVGAEVGERTAAAAESARRAMREGSITARIKAKMALDDNVKALDISVDTDGSTVTLSGVVGNAAQRERALSLARETEGVTQVVDRLRVKG
ncbi:hypothetical protein BH24ACI4_BH24ACI4_07110 [soil metagenome]